LVIHHVQVSQAFQSVSSPLVTKQNRSFEFQKQHLSVSFVLQITKIWNSFFEKELNFCCFFCTFRYPHLQTACPLTEWY